MDRNEAEQKFFEGAPEHKQPPFWSNTEDARVYRNGRIRAMKARQDLVWFIRERKQGEKRIIADLHVRGIATLVMTYDEEADVSTVYETPIRGLRNNLTTVVDDVPFEEGVEAAEAYVAPRIPLNS